MINVRCCCDPNKILGVLVRDIDDMEKRYFVSKDGSKRELAVDSHGRDINYWDEIEGFVADVKADDSLDVGTWLEKKKKKAPTKRKRRK